jgi:Fe-S cluster biogenesis protein NfuA
MEKMEGLDKMLLSGCSGLNRSSIAILNGKEHRLNHMLHELKDNKSDHHGHYRVFHHALLSFHERYWPEGSSYIADWA